MRKIERRMLAAIAAGVSLHMANTTVLCNGDDFAVLLYGNQIATGRSGAITRATLAGWDTATTRSRLRALGVDVPALRRAEGYIRPRPWKTPRKVDVYEI